MFGDPEFDDYNEILYSNCNKNNTNLNFNNIIINLITKKNL